MSRIFDEDISIERRKELLADYLECSPEEIEFHEYTEEFETPEGDYLVFTYDEAYEDAKDYISQTIDEMGLEAFTEGFQEWIIYNALDTDWFEDAYEEYQTELVDELSEDELVEEATDIGILEADDFDEDGNYVGSDSLDFIREAVLEDRLSDDIDYVEWFEENFGKEELRQIINDNDLLDREKIEEECIDEDGIAHFLASYDGEEVDLGEDLFAYRTN